MGSPHGDNGSAGRTPGLMQFSAPQTRTAGAERGNGVPASDGDGGSGGAKPPVDAAARRRRAPPERSGATGSPRATAMGGPAGRSPPGSS